MAHLGVRTTTMSDGNSFASPVTFDFSGDLAAGEQVLAYAVAMSGFVLNIETDSPYWAEKAGQLAVALTPNLFGSALVVGGNAVITDYYGDSAKDPGSSPGNPGSVAQITALAVLGTPGAGAVLGNLFGLPSSQDSAPIGIGANQQAVAFLSGFSVSGAGGSAGSAGGLTLTSSVSSPVADQVKASGVAEMPGFPANATVDIGLLATNALDLTNFQIVGAPVTWSAPDGTNGMTGSFAATFSPPAGASIAQAALLLQDVTILYEDVAEFQMVRAMPVGGLAINGSTVSGTFNLNMYNPDFGAREYIKSESTATLYLIAQFS